VATTAAQVPLLFIIDGVRYERGKEPALSSDQIFAVRVIKGTAAIKRYGQEASYGVVLIITRQAAGPRA
jgi:outer membrane receptor for ferrienterochelin and colicin